MTEEDKSLEEVRQQTWQRLRERRGQARSDQQGGKSQSTNLHLEPFFRLDWGAEAGSAELELENQLAEIRLRLQEARKISRDRQNQPTTEPEPSHPAEKRQEFLQEVVSAHFKNNIQSWLSSVDPELGLSSTPLEELEQRRQEVQYRHKLLQVMLEATQRELDELELHVRAQKSLNT